MSKSLQSYDSDLSTAISYAETTVSAISNIRQHVKEEFSAVFNEYNEMANMLGNEISQPRIIRRQTQRTKISADSCESYYRISIFIPWSENLKTSLETRFLKHKDILGNFSCLLPLKENTFSKETLAEKKM